MAEIRRGFELSGDGLRAASARALVVDDIVLRLWHAETELEPRLLQGVAFAAVGGFGRNVLFPFSDVDLLFCVERSQAELAKQPIRKLSQQLWDCGLQVSITTRTPSECERFESTNPEFGISLLDMRPLGGDAETIRKLQDKAIPKLRQRDAKSIATELARLTRERHGKYGNTLFHLEPNIKECPGGLRDANVAEWLHSLRAHDSLPRNGELQEATAFLAAVRCFLHYRHERDDNTLDWLAQDAAAEQGIGLGRPPILPPGTTPSVDAAYWMRAYFRYARIVERFLLREAEGSGLRIEAAWPVRRIKVPPNAGFDLNAGRISLASTTASGQDVAHDPEIVLSAFTVMARTRGNAHAGE